MLKRLHIRNFRGFDELEIGELRRINLVAGGNNSGKTTLLEAIFLLSGAANARMAVNDHVIRDQDRGKPPRSWAEIYWKPLFSGLDTNRTVTVSGHHTMVGDMALTISWGRQIKTEISRDSDALLKARSDERSLKFTYVDQEAGELESEAQETAEKFEFEQEHKYVPFLSAILQPGGGDVNEDAMALGRLRTQKRGNQLLDALRVVEPRLQAIEDNSSSGAPMIWVDLGLRELIPLSVMGAGMTHVARIVLTAASVIDGALLIDEIENGLHHSVLTGIWRVIAKAAEQFNVQIFATTHSFECVEAAHEALGSDGFGLHRLEIVEGVTRCVTLSPMAISGAIRHNMEVR